jgi:hypothetical protein
VTTCSDAIVVFFERLLSRLSNDLLGCIPSCSSDDLCDALVECDGCLFECDDLFSDLFERQLPWVDGLFDVMTVLFMRRLPQGVVRMMIHFS